MSFVLWASKPAYAQEHRNNQGKLSLFFLFAIPLYITYAYQLMPVPVRKIWGMRGDGSSHIVVGTAVLGETNLWPTFLRCCSGIRYLPGYAVGAALRPFLGGRGNPWKTSPWVMTADPDSINWFHLGG